jgi:hypothetical protein
MNPSLISERWRYRALNARRLRRVEPSAPERNVGGKEERSQEGKCVEGSREGVVEEPGVTVAIDEPELEVRCCNKFEPGGDPGNVSPGKSTPMMLLMLAKI